MGSKQVTFYGDGGSFAVESPFNRAFVDELKQAVPSSGRQWKADDKRWVVAAHYLDTMGELVQRHYGRKPVLTGEFGNNPETEKTFLLEYIGNLKDRGGGVFTCNGWWNGGWNATFPIAALQAHFGFDADKTESNHYATLGVQRGAAGAAIKKAHRRAARSWHPDVCKEPDAAEQFRRVQEAYEILMDPAKRRLYDAGLAYVDDAERFYANGGRSEIRDHQWRPPVRCGQIRAKVIEAMGKLEVVEILAWDDVVDAQGRTMVSSWPKLGRRYGGYADHFVVEWRE